MKSIFLTVAVVVCGLFVNLPVASALTISPVRVEVSGDPGQTLRGELEIYNEQNETKRFYTSYENFEPSGDTGSPHFVGSADGLATWMSAEPSVSIAPQEKKVIPYFITIPKNAEPGGYFAAIFLGEQDPGNLQAGEVSIGGKLGVLMLLRVNGDIAEAAGLSEFSTPSPIVTALPVVFTYRFTNDGGDRVVPLGDVVIRNTFNSVTKTITANELEGNVLPGSSRRFTALWGDDIESPVGFFATIKNQLQHFHFGLYRAHIHVVYGANNQAAEDVLTFFIVPWQLLTCIVFGLLAVFTILRQYNAWIIARSRR